MDLHALRTAYSSRSQEYIDLFDGDWDANEMDAGFIRRHLGGREGPVLDLGCGPGYWTDYLHRLGAQATGVDMVPEFIDHARARHPGPAVRLGSITSMEGARARCSRRAQLVLDDPPSARGTGRCAR